VGVDGVYGRPTLAAVRSLQHRKGLPPTGEVDAGTWAALDQTALPVD
jgi:peptidoglycan hydrolase-like protein with peptidoglycan-binding domain